MIDFKRLKIAAYLDQVSEDPHNALKIAKELDICNIVLRRCWSKSIVDTGDQQHRLLLNNITTNGLAVVLISTDIGNCPADRLMNEESRLNTALKLCEYYKCNNIKVGTGKKSHDQRSNVVQEAWFKLVDRRCAELNIIPSFEIVYEHTHSSPVELASLLHKYKRFKIIYDPACLVATKKLDPYTKYWSLINDRVSHIDIRDFKIGHAPVMVGDGDCKIDLTILDAATKGFQGWLCLEPGLTRKYGDITGLDNVFKLTTKTFLGLLSKLEAENENQKVT